MGFDGGRGDGGGVTVGRQSPMSIFRSLKRKRLFVKDFGSDEVEVGQLSLIMPLSIYFCVYFRMLFNCTKEGRAVILFLPNKWATGDFKD